VAVYDQDVERWLVREGLAAIGPQVASPATPRSLTIMKKVLMAAALLSLLAGCVVVPTRRGYVAAPAVIAPPVVVVHPAYRPYYY